MNNTRLLVIAVGLILGGQLAFAQDGRQSRRGAVRLFADRTAGR